MATAQQTALNDQWRELRLNNPRLRIREAAHILGVSEAELVALNQSGKNVRLAGDFKKLMTEVETAGRVMALTRNDVLVHEKTGQYQNLSLHGNMGLALGVIDLRLFFSHFVYGFAVWENTQSGERQSLQFFNATGQAVHKIYATEDTDLAAFAALTERYRAADDVPPLVINQTESVDDLLTTPETLDVAALVKDWQALQDVHHFQAMLKRHNLQRIPAYRAVGDEMARPLEPTVFEAALTQAAARELSVMLFVGNAGVIQIHTGTISNLKRTGPWFNVLDPDFNLHADTTRIDSVWLVRKPTADGIVTSLELFDSDGRQLGLMFGERHNGETELAGWRELVAGLEEVYQLPEEVVL